MVETARTRNGTLALRGPMVPAQPFLPGSSPATDGSIDTGFTCAIDGDALSITAPPAGITAVGGYRFRQNDVDWLVAKADLRAKIAALPDAMLGQRFAGTAPDPAVSEAQLQAHGVNPLIAGAFRPRSGTQAA